MTYGTASVLQGVGARRTAASSGLDARLLLRLARQVPYVAGTALDLVGFALSVVALRTLPLFAVQAAMAAAVGVTALLAAVALHERLSRSETVALAGILAGLVLLGLSAQPEHATPLSRLGGWLVLGGATLVAAAGALVARRPGGALGLGGLAGLAFGGVGVAARAVRVPHPLWHGLGDPLVWALAAYGLLGTLLYATALQRHRVAGPTAALFAAETVGPALVGIAFLGDSARHGFVPVAAAGFVLTVACCLALARYGEVG